MRDIVERTASPFSSIIGCGLDVGSSPVGWFIEHHRISVSEYIKMARAYILGITNHSWHPEVDNIEFYYNEFVPHAKYMETYDDTDDK
jgi:hypothetical protein